MLKCKVKRGEETIETTQVVIEIGNTIYTLSERFGSLKIVKSDGDDGSMYIIPKTGNHVEDEQLIKRLDQLSKLDMKFNFKENSYYGYKENNSDFNVHMTEIQCDDEQEWDKKIEGLEKEYERRKHNPIN